MNQKTLKSLILLLVLLAANTVAMPPRDLDQVVTSQEITL